MGKAQRDKGKRWEREIARMFRDAMPGTDPHRGHQSRDGADAADVEGVPRFWVEAKHRAAISPEAALRQAQTECPQNSGRWPVAIVKRNRSEPFVAMDLADFLELVSEWWREVKPEQPR